MSKLDPTKPTVLLIGSLDYDGILSLLKASKRQYKLRRLESSVKNWLSICEQIEELPIKCVLLKLTSVTYHNLVDPNYAAVRDRLLTHIASVPNMVFTFEALLSDAPDDEVSQRNDLESWQYWHGLPPARIREEVNRLLAEYSFEVIPYRQNAELTVLASAFISDTEDGLLFRVYVPSGRIWANETDRLLQLFQDYLARVGHQSVRLDQRRTERGIVYELYGDQGLVQNKSTGHLFVQDPGLFSASRPCSV